MSKETILLEKKQENPENKVQQDLQYVRDRIHQLEL